MTENAAQPCGHPTLTSASAEAANMLPCPWPRCEFGSIGVKVLVNVQRASGTETLEFERFAESGSSGLLIWGWRNLT